MERKITITASNGEVFTGTNYQELEKQVNCYELELSKKKQEAAERQKKAEAEKKEREAIKSRLLEQIKERAEALDKTVKEYENTTGDKLSYVTENGVLKVQRANRYFGNGFYSWFNLF